LILNPFSNITIQVQAIQNYSTSPYCNQGFILATTTMASSQPYVSAGILDTIELYPRPMNPTRPRIPINFTTSTARHNAVHLPPTRLENAIERLPQSHNRDQNFTFTLPPMVQKAREESTPPSVKPQVDINTPSYLLSLPLELRLTILNHVHHDRTAKLSGTMYTLQVNSPPTQTISLICRQIRDEVLGDFYQSRTFIALPDRNQAFLPGDGAFPCSHVPHIQRLEIHYHLSRSLSHDDNYYARGYYGRMDFTHPKPSGHDFGTINHKSLEYILTVLENFAPSLSELTITWCNTDIQANWCPSFVKTLVSRRRHGDRFQIYKDPYHELTGDNLRPYHRFQAFQTRNPNFVLRIKRDDFPRSLAERKQQERMETLILIGEHEEETLDIGEVKRMAAKRCEDMHIAVPEELVGKRKRREDSNGWEVARRDLGDVQRLGNTLSLAGYKIDARQHYSSGF
jgi:hypothetical protein